MTSTVATGLAFHSLGELARRLDAGETTSVAIVEACLAAIDAQDAKLHAFIEVWRDDALDRARSADRERRAGTRGPLHGLPIAIKDLVHMRARQTTAGSRTRMGELATETAPALARLLEAGMIPLGKTHLVEFAYGTWGINRPLGTPWNPCDRNVHRVPGGSSSGSAVAVAAGMAPAALGTDTGGSIRIPAALCGVVGLKPTYGRVPLDGVVALASTLDSVGPIALTVEDAALLTAVMAGESVPAFDRVESIEGMHITALSRAQFPDFTEPAIVAAFDATIARLRELGVDVDEETIPFDFPALAGSNGQLIRVEAYARHRALVDDPRSELDPGVRARCLAAKEFLAVDYVALLEERLQAIPRFDNWMRGRDALLTPMLPITAIPVAEVDETTYPLSTWSGAVNYLRGCGLSIPVGRPAGALPIGMQLVGAGGTDEVIVRIGRALQAAIRTSSINV